MRQGSLLGSNGRAPNGGFFAKIWEVQQALAEKVQSDEYFRALFAGRRHSLSFSREVRRKDVQEFCERFVKWAIRRDWSGSDDVYVDDPWLAAYVPAITRRIVSISPGVGLNAGPLKPLLDCARLANAFSQEDYLPAVLNAIEIKKAKQYRADAPIWLAVTAVQPLDALMLRVSAVDVDPGQFSRIYLSDTQDTVLYEIVEH